MILNARTYLETYEWLYRQAERLTEQIQRIDAQIYAGAGAIRYDSDRIVSSPGDRLTDKVCRKVELENILKYIRTEMNDIHDDFVRLFSLLPEFDREVAELTWLDFEGSIYISQVCGCSRQKVWRSRQNTEQFVQSMLPS